MAAAPIPTEPGLVLEPAEQAVLVEEVRPFAEALGDPAARRRYDRLDAAVRSGVVPEALVPPLEAMLELVLQTQRVRRRHGPEAEQALVGLLARTPRGLASRQATRAVNQGLRALAGQRIRSISFSPTPGGQRLILETDACQVALTIDRAGVRLERAEVGG